MKSPRIVKFSNLTMSTVALSVFLRLVICSTSESLNPVVLIPGLGGNQMFVKLHDFKRHHWYCKKNTGWDNVWVNLVKLEFTSCFVDTFKLKIEKDGTTTNQDGVETLVPAFGDTSSIEWLSPNNLIRSVLHKQLGYFVDIVERLVNKMSYVRNVSIRGAPYDFRKAPNEMANYMEELTTLIEDTYKINDNKKVVIIGHSLGGNVALYFLHSKSQEWKDKYISSFISLGSPWAGSLKAMKILASGDRMGLPKIIVRKSIKLRPLERSMPSVAWMMPQWSEYYTEPLIISPYRNYTVDDYDAFYDDIDFKEGKVLRKKTENLSNPSIGPGVNTHCLYGLNLHNTARTLVFKEKNKNWYDAEPDVLFGPGDETVSKISLEMCKWWPNTTVLELHDVNHAGILSDTKTIDYIEEVLRS